MKTQIGMGVEPSMRLMLRRRDEAQARLRRAILREKVRQMARMAVLAYRASRAREDDGREGVVQ